MARHLKIPLFVASDFLYVVVSREEVEAEDTTQVMGTLRQLLASPEVAFAYRERVDIAFDGYNDDARELGEIPQIRQFVWALDEQFPCWLYFLSKYHSGLSCILACFLPPNLTEEAKRKIYPQRLQEYLLNRGLPAMNQLCELTDCSEEEVTEMTDRVMRYIQFGKLPLEES
jgi:hypothetical protein